MENYTIVYDLEKNYIYNDNGLVLVQDNTRRLLLLFYYNYIKHEYISVKELKWLPLQNADEEQLEETITENNEKENINNTNTEESDGRWTYNGTLNLIDQYKKNEGKFKSSTIRKDAIWKIISDKLKVNQINFNALQCENKFKNLKRRYMMKCDNMKSTATGAPTIKFDFFYELNEIFGKKPNIEPLAIASSSRQNIINDSLPADLESNSEVNIENKNKLQMKMPTTSTMRKSKADKFMAEMRKMEIEREEKRRNRHLEKMELQREAMKVFGDKMDKLIDKL